MQNQNRKLTQAVLLVAALFAATATSPVSAQVSAVGSTDVRLYLRLDRYTKIEQALGSLAQGAILENCEFDGLLPGDAAGLRKIDPNKISSERILRSTFEEMQELEPDPTADAPIKSASGRSSFQRLPSRIPVYGYSLTEAGTLLKSMTVTYRDGQGNEIMKPHEAKSFSASDAELQMTQPGQYVLKPDPAWGEPVRYEAMLEKLDGTAVEPDKGEWPATEKFYRLVLRNFKGDLQKMLDAVKPQDPPRVANPIDIAITRDFKLVFGSVGRFVDKTTPDITESGMNLIAGKLEKRQSTSVWVYFPLSKAEAAKAWKDLRLLSAADMPQRIREQQPLRVVDGEQQDFVLEPGMKPRWIELKKKADGEGFSRYVKFKDFMTVYEAYPELWYLVSYEFDNPADKLPAEAQTLEATISPEDLPVTEEQFATVPRTVEDWAGRAKTIATKLKAQNSASTNPASGGDK